MKKTLTLVLAIAFFSTLGFAGDQGTGGYRPCDPQVETCPPPPDCTENCGNNSSMATQGGSGDDVLSDLAFDTISSIAITAFGGGH
ncbi:MAG: hypothetical protein JO053_12170 [Acidobacteria bacterium]|nr:hypothetical protein [Acidobacteriota bacterium]